MFEYRAPLSMRSPGESGPFQRLQNVQARTQSPSSGRGQTIASPVSVTRVDLHDDPVMVEWDAFVRSHPQGTPFHLSCWLRIIERTYRFEPVLYVLRDPSGKPVGALPLFEIRNCFHGPRLVSVPFSDYGGLLSVGGEAAPPALGDILRLKAGGVRYCEFRGGTPPLADCISQRYYKRHVLRLAVEPGDVLKRVDKRTVQYSIRKAERRGVIVRVDNEPQGMEQFYELHRVARKRHGVPCPPFAFFKHLHECIVQTQNGFVLLARSEEHPVAGGVFLALGDVLYFKYLASDPVASRTLAPNHLLTWTAVQEACRQRRRWFDFGRTAPDNLGLMRFKSMWGAEEREAFYYHYPNVAPGALVNEADWKFHFLSGVWQRLPRPVVDTLGPRLYRYAA